ncbi:signal peptidase I [Thiorhodovibrio frisius]|uniref:Signal peptidase I n=1 Tax=Thiorhodovibrio frisius TaxID=631362 RepID=H8YWH3_9GAMM|nr:signal peptidase I [Thiorhodovibrio frisius]EIC22799.1 signal peptidase I [Thiorhodovibrio frisius]WPL22942.1 Signal peptidase IB [Thiorhodovibrio frisius]
MIGSALEAKSHPKLKPSREPWDRFAMKALLVLTAMLILIGYGCARYRIGIDDQVSQCLPPYRWYLIDTFDRQSIKRDQLRAFAATEVMAPYFRREQTIIKRVAGIPGDQVSVTAEGTSINGVMQPESDPALAKALGLSVADFLVGSLTIPEGFLWVMGATRDSFDSRYWRLLPQNQVIGRAYALF